MNTTIDAKGDTMNSRHSALLPLVSLLIATGCGDQGELDVGDETASIGSALSDYAADWDGYAEAYQVPGDGTDRVRLVLDEAGVGTLRLGEAELIPTPTAPEDTYPPSIGGEEEDPLAAIERAESFYLRAGFAYPVAGAQVTNDRLRFSIEPSSLMDPWCALVTEDVATDFTCGGHGFAAGIDENGEAQCTTGTKLNTPIDCDIAIQCGRCECEGDTCVGADRGEALFDAALTDDGKRLEGTLVTDDDQRVTVRMTR